MFTRHQSTIEANNQSGKWGRSLIVFTSPFRRGAWQAATRLIVCLYLISFLLLTTYAPVYAHASPVRSTPESGEVVENAPSEFMIEFTEEVEPNSVQLQLLNVDGINMTLDAPLIDPADPKIVRLTMPPLEDGAYGVHWLVQSTVDGHITRGSVNFAIGDADTFVSTLPPSGTVALTWQWPAVVDVLQRWVSLLGMALAFGSIAFVLVIWRSLEMPAKEAAGIASWLRRRVVRLVWIGVLLMMVGSFAYIYRQASESAIATAIPVSGAVVKFMTTQIGLVILTRLALLVVLAIVARFMEKGTGKGGVGAWWLALGLSAAMLLTYSLQSHSAAVSTLILLADYVHVLAMATWLGGLLVLLSLLLRRDAEAKLPWGMLVQRFSNIALASVLLLSASGLMLAYIHVRTIDALLDTAYGWLLMGKSALFVLILAAAATNLLLLVPRLRRGARTATSFLLNSVRYEVAVGIILLASVGALTATAPAYETLKAQQRQGIFHHAVQDQVDLTVRIAPGVPGNNEFAVDVIDARSGAAAMPGQLLLRFTHLQHDMGEQEIELTAVDDVRYATLGSYLTMSGNVQVEVILRRPGFNDVRNQFEIVMPSTVAQE